MIGRTRNGGFARLASSPQSTPTRQTFANSSSPSSNPGGEGRGGGGGGGNNSWKWRKSISSGVRLLHEAVNSNLNHLEREYFIRYLNQYHLEKDAFQLVQHLKQILDTPSKKRLFVLLRGVIPPAEVDHFDQCCQILLGPQFKAIFRGGGGGGGGVGNHARAYSTPNLSGTVGDSASAPWREDVAAQSLAAPLDSSPSPSRRNFLFASKSSTPPMEHNRSRKSSTSSSVQQQHVLQQQPLHQHPLNQQRQAQHIRSASNPSSPSPLAQGLHRRSSSVSSVASSNASSRPAMPLRRVSSWSSLSLLETPLKTIVLKPLPSQTNLALGFSVRGGRQQGIGIYVTVVEPGSHADTQGLVVGDQIVSANDIPFDAIAIQDAVKIMKAACPLTMQIQRVGRMPGSKEAHQTFVWADADGNPRPPPPEVVKEGRYSEEAGTKSSSSSTSGVAVEIRLLERDERRLELLVVDENRLSSSSPSTEPRRPLGLMIRGGKEYGLGIYVTRVDAGSPAANAGLCVGDQILDVDGISFFDVTHADACAALKNNRKTKLTISAKAVGRVPKGKAGNYDPQQQQQRQTIQNQQSSAAISRNSSSASSPQPTRPSRDPSVRSSPLQRLSPASSIGSSASQVAAAAAAAASAAGGVAVAPVNRRTRSASPLAQLSHLAARLPTPSSIKLKRKQRKQKTIENDDGEIKDDHDGGGGAGGNGGILLSSSSRSSSLQRPASTPLIVDPNTAPEPPFFHHQRQSSNDASIASSGGGGGLGSGVGGSSSGGASPIFHRGLGSQMNLTLERGTVLARTRNAIVEESREKLGREEHRTLDYYLDE